MHNLHNEYTASTSCCPCYSLVYFHVVVFWSVIYECTFSDHVQVLSVELPGIYSWVL